MSGFLIWLSIESTIHFLSTLPTMALGKDVEILRVVTYNTQTVQAIGQTTGSSQALQRTTSRYYKFLMIVCLGSTIAIPSVLIFVIGLMYQDIGFYSQKLWEIALYILISCILSFFICHCYRYEAFELYFRHNAMQKRIMHSGWHNVVERWQIQNEDANMDTIKLFRKIPYVLPIADRIDRNVMWFVRKTYTVRRPPKDMEEELTPNNIENA